ncbi:unnamed protein product [Ectocarpus sp. 13 AM-2016]
MLLLWSLGESRDQGHAGGKRGVMTAGATLAFLLPLIHPQPPPHLPLERKRMDCQPCQPLHQQRVWSSRRSPAALLPSAKLSVCTEEDCVQQGAYQTLARLEKVAKGKDIQVDTCPCLGMCGLGPCVSIDWDGSRMESRGGIFHADEEAALKLVSDALEPPPEQEPSVSQERDPYEEQ